VDFNVTEYDSITPQPRLLRPKPETNPEIQRSDPIAEEVPEDISSNQSSEYSRSMSPPTKSEIDPVFLNQEENSCPLQISNQSQISSNLIDYVPKELYLQQQQTILSLQRQIEMLNQEIEFLKHHQSIPLNPPSISQGEISVPWHEVSRLEETAEGSASDLEELSGVEFDQSSYVPTELEEEEESFLCEKPFEKCEMEAPSIFNFDLFIQSLRHQNGQKHLSPSSPHLALFRDIVDFDIITNRVSTIFRPNILI
jgi:hypothetical protein